MYTNLQTALRRKGVSIKEYANFLGVSVQQAADKLQGDIDFTYAELNLTCTRLLPEYNADYLFAQSSHLYSNYHITQ